jgi:pseudouridine-5'-phosphate glycosidase
VSTALPGVPTRAPTTGSVPTVLTVLPEVADALAAHRPVVALESTIISHGLPRPDNLRIAREIEEAVRSAGAVPATIAVVDGRACVGLDDDSLTTIATSAYVVKVSTRDLATLVARKGTGATTVAATSHLAAQAGIRLYATGGLGGVHRDARSTWDESADLQSLATTPVAVVCAGVKSILDVPATLERLETLGVPVIGVGSDAFPGFYLTDSGHRVDWRVDTAEEVAAVLAAQDALGTADRGTVVANPLPVGEQVDPELHERLLQSGLAAAESNRVTGKDVTPFLLDWFHRESDGVTLRANVRIVLRNADLAARIAAAAAGAT